MLRESFSDTSLSAFRHLQAEASGLAASPSRIVADMSLLTWSLPWLFSVSTPHFLTQVVFDSSEPESADGLGSRVSVCTSQQSSCWEGCKMLSSTSINMKRTFIPSELDITVSVTMCDKSTQKVAAFAVCTGVSGVPVWAGFFVICLTFRHCWRKTKLLYVHAFSVIESQFAWNEGCDVRPDVSVYNMQPCCCPSDTPCPCADAAVQVQAWWWTGSRTQASSWRRETCGSSGSGTPTGRWRSRYSTLLLVLSQWTQLQAAVQNVWGLHFITVCSLFVINCLNLSRIYRLLKAQYVAPAARSLN